MNYDSYLFIDIINTDPRVNFLGQVEKDGYLIFKYQGASGNLVTIDMSEDFIPDATAKNHLDNLGLSDLIPGMFNGN